MSTEPAVGGGGRFRGWTRSVTRRHAGSLGGPLPDRVRLLVLLGFLALLLCAPEITSVPNVRLLTLVVTTALVALGLHMTFGYSGQLALGHVFFFAASGYAVAVMSRHTQDVFVLIVVGVVVAVVATLVTVPGLRLAGWSLAMASLFLVVLIPDIVQFRTSLTGGLGGIYGILRPTVFGHSLDNNGLYRVMIVLLGLWLLFQRGFIYSGYGRMLAALRHSETSVTALGVSVFRLKLFVYLLSAVPAALAGVSAACLDSFIAPTSFTIETLTFALAAIVLGGLRTLYGPLVGAFIVVTLQQRLTFLQSDTLIVFGAVLTLGAVAFRTGIAGLVARWLPAPPVYLTARHGGEHALDENLGPAVPGDLVVEGVSKRFGGNQALLDVGLSARAGEVTALIGPNGSGKTTLLNAISGFVRVDGGHILVGDADIARIPAVRVAGHGVARTFQTPTLAPELTVREAVATAAFRVRGAKVIGTVCRLPAWRREEAALAGQVDQVLAFLGLTTEESTGRVDALPLGRKRLVEIARAVIMRPALILLDEPASGLTPKETQRLADLLRHLANQQTTVLLVEHNMDLVLGVADKVFVLAQGQVLSSGTPKEVSADDRVLAAYLGTGPTPTAPTATTSETSA